VLASTTLAQWLPDLLVWLASIPVAALVAWLIARWRVRRGLQVREAWRRSLTEVGIVATTVPWLWMILTPLPEPGLVHLMPFSDLRGQFHHPPAYVVEQIGGNLLVFAGFGFLAPIRWHIRPQWIVLVATLGSATVETLQWTLHLGRVASVDDVLVNTVGALLAALCSRPWWRSRDTGHVDATRPDPSR
jgi:hypothetical protein